MLQRAFTSIVFLCVYLVAIAAGADAAMPHRTKILFVHNTPIDIEISGVRAELGSEIKSVRIMTLLTKDKLRIYQYIKKYDVNHIFVFGEDLCGLSHYLGSNVMVNVPFTCGAVSVVREASFKKLIDYWKASNFYPDHHILVSDRVLSPLLMSSSDLNNAEMRTVKTVIELRGVLQRLNTNSAAVLVNGIERLTDEFGKPLTRSKISEEISMWNTVNIDISLFPDDYPALVLAPDPYGVGKAVGKILLDVIERRPLQSIEVESVLWVNQRRMTSLGVPHLVNPMLGLHFIKQLR